MSVNIIGIDVGGSTTKIVGFDNDRNLIEPMFVRAADPITSTYGAFGKFLSQNNLSISDIKRVMVTGVGSSYITQPIYNLECVHVSEFECIGLGGLYLSGLERAVVVSMGTGTPVVYAESKPENKMNYLGGTGIGGGTLMGLSKIMLGVNNYDSIIELASKGDLNNIDLRVGDITNKNILPGMPRELTAANFGKVSDLAGKSDIALGLINIVFETAGMIAIFASRNSGTNDIIVIGSVSQVPQGKQVFQTLNAMYKINFIIPDHSQYGTVIGAALSGLKDNN